MFEDALDLLRDTGERLHVVPEHLDLDRRRRAFEVADHVLQQLDEFDLDARRRLGQVVTQGVDHLAGGTALASRLQPHEDVAAVLLRREQAELGAGAAGVRQHVRRLLNDLFHLSQHAIGLLQGAAGRRQVVDDESAFVGLGQEARCRSA